MNSFATVGLSTIPPDGSSNIIFRSGLEEGFFDYLWAQAPHLLIILLLIGFAIWITGTVVSLYHRFILVEQHCSHQMTVVNPEMNRRFTSLESKLTGMQLTLAKIATFLLTEKGLTANIFESNSPLQLTDLGYNILSESGGKKYIDENQTSLVMEIVARNPKSGLDAQAFCSQLLLERSQDDGFTPIKNYVFKNPVFSSQTESGKRVTLEMGIVCEIMTVYLRSRYLTEVKFIDQNSDSRPDIVDP